MTSLDEPLTASPTGAEIILDGEDRWISVVERPAIYRDPDMSVDDLYAWLRRDNGDLRGDDAAFERAGEALFETRFVFDDESGVLLGFEGVGDDPSMDCSTLVTSRVVDTLPRRAAP